MKAYWLNSKENISGEALNAEGVLFENLPLIRDVYQTRLDELKTIQGYIHQDEVRLDASMSNLDEICAKFDGEHSHDEDEVRYVLEGEGIFDIRSNQDQMMRVIVQSGDLIVVPQNRNHRFELTEQRAIHCIRLFKDATGWVPHYRDSNPSF
jgi:1,2-dihydroxy-3-keto-5-methylthiopentene dioxygenase